MSTTYDDLYDVINNMARRNQLSDEVRDFLNIDIDKKPSNIEIIYTEDIQTVVSNACLINEIKQENGTTPSYMLLMSKFLLHEFYVNYDKYIGKIPNEYFKNDNEEERKTQIMELLRKLSESFKNMRYEEGIYDKVKDQIDGDISFLNTNEYLYIPRGFATENMGHAISFIIKKIGDDNYTIYYLNEGYGCEYFLEDYGQKVQGFINITNVNTIKLRYFLLCLRYNTFGNHNDKYKSNIEVFLGKVFFKMLMDNSLFDEKKTIDENEILSGKKIKNLIEPNTEIDLLSKTYKEYENLNYKNGFLSTPQIVGNCGFIACTIPYYLLIDEYINDEYIEETLNYMKECISSIVFGLYLDYFDYLFDNSEEYKINASDREIIYYYKKIIKKAKKDNIVYSDNNINYVFENDTKIKLVMDKKRIDQFDIIYNRINENNFLLQSINKSLNNTKDVFINYGESKKDELEIINNEPHQFDGKNYDNSLNILDLIKTYINNFSLKQHIIIKSFAFKGLCELISKLYEKTKNNSIDISSINLSTLINTMSEIITKIINFIISSKKEDSEKQYYISFDYYCVNVIINYVFGKFFYTKTGQKFTKNIIEKRENIKKIILTNLSVISNYINYRNNKLLEIVNNILNSDEIEFMVYVDEGSYVIAKINTVLNYTLISGSDYPVANTEINAILMSIIKVIYYGFYPIGISFFKYDIKPYFKDFKVIKIKKHKGSADFDLYNYYYGIIMGSEHLNDGFSDFENVLKSNNTHINMISKVINNNYEILFNDNFLNELIIYNQHYNSPNNEIAINNTINLNNIKNKITFDMNKFFNNAISFINDEGNIAKKLYILGFLISIIEYYEYELNEREYEIINDILETINPFEYIDNKDLLDKIKNNIKLCFYYLAQKTGNINQSLKNKFNIDTNIDKIINDYDKTINLDITINPAYGEKELLQKFGVYMQSIVVKLFPLSTIINNNIMGEMLGDFKKIFGNNYDNEKYNVGIKGDIYKTPIENIITHTSPDPESKNIIDIFYDIQKKNIFDVEKFDIHLRRYSENAQYFNYSNHEIETYGKYGLIINKNHKTKILYFIASNLLFPIYYQINGIEYIATEEIFNLYYNPVKYTINDKTNIFNIVMPINLQYKFIRNFVFIKKADGVIESLDKKDSSDKIIINNNSGDFIYNGKTYYDMYKVFKTICGNIELTNLLIISNLYEIIMYEEEGDILIIELNNYDIKFSFNKTSKILTYDKYTVITNKISNIHNFINNTRETMLNALIIYDNIKYKIILFSDIYYKNNKIGYKFNPKEINRNKNRNTEKYYEIIEYTPNYDNFLITTGKQAELLFYSALYFNDLKTLIKIYYICGTFFRNYVLSNFNNFFKELHTNIFANFFKLMTNINDTKLNKFYLFLSLENLRKNNKVSSFINTNNENLHFSQYDIQLIKIFEYFRDIKITCNTKIKHNKYDVGATEEINVININKDLIREFNNNTETYLYIDYFFFSLVKKERVDNIYISDRDIKFLYLERKLINLYFLICDALMMLYRPNYIKKDDYETETTMIYRIMYNSGASIYRSQITKSTKYGNDIFHKINTNNEYINEINGFFNDLKKIITSKEEYTNKTLNYDLIKTQYNKYFENLDNNNNKITLYKCTSVKLREIKIKIENFIVKKYNNEYKINNYFINIALNMSYIILNLINEILKSIPDTNDNYEVNDVYEYLNILSREPIYISEINDDIEKLNKIIKLYENFFGFPARPEQIKVIEEVYRDLDKGNKPRIHQLLMGGGKTSFIIPIILLYCVENNKYKNLFYVLPTTLVKQSVEIITKYISHIIPYKILTLNITRYEDRLFSKLNHETNNIIILSDTSIKSHILNNKKNYIDNTTTEKEETLIITDEIDDVLDPLKSELNYPVNEDKLFDLYREIKFNLIYNVVREICLNKFMMVKYNRDTRVNHLVLNNTDDIKQIYSELLIKGFFTTSEYFSRYAEYIDYNKLLLGSN